MVRLKALNPEETTGKSKELFDGIQKKLGSVPNIMRAMGNSPALLQGYLSLSDALGTGTLGAKTGELIALAVAQENTCDYCLSAHSFIGGKMLKIDDESLTLARQGKNEDSKIQAALTFAKTLVNKRGHVEDEDVEALKAVGYTEGEIGEIVAHVALNTLTNYFNHTANTEIDFPEVKAV